MQAKLFFLLFLLSSISTFAQERNLKPNEKSKYYAYTPDGKVNFEISLTKVIIQFNNGLSFQEQANILKKYNQLMPLKKEHILPSPKVCIAACKAGINEAELETLLINLNKESAIRYANEFLVYHDGSLQGIMDRVIVKLKSTGDLNMLREKAKELNFEIEKQYPYDRFTYFIKTSKQSKGNALGIANQLSESGLFASAEVDFLLFLKKFNTNDTFLPYQWSLNNTGSSLQFNGTPGCDMNVFNAWGLSTGSASIKVAIIDEGVDLVHPDLQANMLPGYDGTLQNSGGAPQGDDAHGTACAGIVAAVGNNNLGVAGIAYNSKIVPIRIAYSSGSSWVTSNAWIGASIDWAWDQGDADVLSNSWGGGSSSALINDAINRAVTQGRNGLGSPVLFAAGNDNGAVSYPATLSNVISVTAMSMCNQRKNPSSCDGESWWGSNFGTNTDISAPGVKIYTTDISGTAGYSTGNYEATFNGTSSACPNAAGVMALILSVNSNLTMAQARQIIESTCDKVGGYTYNSGVSGQPNGTWSTDLGYGKVNAFAALQAANPQPCVSPPPVAITSASPSTFCSPTSVSFTLSGILFGTGQTYQWQSSPNNTTYTNITGANLSAYTATLSTSAWYRCNVTCGGITTSSTPVQVTYTNPTVTSFPHTVNFDASSSLPCGWSVQDVNTDGYGWTIITTNSQSAPNNISYSYNPSAAANDWAFSAPLNLTAGVNYQVRFSYRVRSASYPENLEVKWGNAASAVGMTSAAIFTGTALTNTTYTQATSSVISPAVSGTYFIGFRAFSNANMWDIHVDNVIIEVAPTCSTPPIGGTISGPLTVQGGSSNTYTLTGHTGSIQWEQSPNNTSWTAISGATSASQSLTFNPGTVYLRAALSSPGCVTAYSNTLTVTVNSLIGDVFSNPIIASTLPFNQTISNAGGYTNAYTGPNNQSSPDFFIRFTTGNCTDSIKISTCGSGFDTYLHLLNSSGTHITSLDDNGPYCSGTAASLKYDIQPNTTYYAVFEGYGSATGNIIVNIEEIGNSVQTLTATASGSTTFCQGGSVTLTVSPSSGIEWNTGATSASINVTTSGNYFAIIPGQSGCTPTSNVITVVVNPLPTVTAGNVSGCSGTPVNLIGSPAGGTFSIPNPYSGPSTTYTYTYTDANGCTATSAPATVNINSGLCYCTPTLGTNALGCTDGDVIAKVTLNTLTNTSGAGCPSGVAGYSDYSSTSGLTTTLLSGTAYTLEVSVGQYSQNVAVWIDLDNDGTFASTERMAFTSTAIAGSGSVGVISPTIGYLNFTIPCGTSTGSKRMRVRSNWSSATAGSAIVPCASTALYGETEDYTIDVIDCTTTLNLKSFLQGYYSGSQSMSSALFNQGITATPPITNADVDYITVELHNASSPYAMVASQNCLLKTNGTATCAFNTPISGSYYVAIKNRSGIETWSATPINIINNILIDLSTIQSAAYGSNLVEVENGVWAMYSGDIDQNGYLELDDYNLWDIEYQAGFPHSDYTPDLDGNGYVELDDYNIWDVNYQNGVFSQRP